MAKGTTFGILHSNTDLRLIQQSVSVQPAKPKTKYVDVPGADGAIDLTEALGVGVKFEDREITWTFALYPGDDWRARQMTVSNAINGQALHIVLDDDSGWYYDGRVTVDSYASDRLLRQITVKAICRPYKCKATASTVTRSLTTSQSSITLSIGRKPLIPTVTVTAQTTISFNGASTTISAGTHTLAGLYMSGDNTVTAKTVSGTGTITFSWREGAL